MGSAEASGSFGRSTTFSSWKGRAYARVKTVPANPKTAMQTSVRAMMGFLAHVWSTLTTPEKTTWNTPALDAKIPPYNQFISENLGRWSEFHAPSKAHPATEAGSQPEFDETQVNGRVAHVDITATFYDLADAFGLVIFRSQASGFVPSLANVIAVEHHINATAQAYVDEGLSPGLWYYNFRTFNHHGQWSANLGQKTATVT